MSYDFREQIFLTYLSLENMIDCVVNWLDRDYNVPEGLLNNLTFSTGNSFGRIDISAIEYY